MKNIINHLTVTVNRLLNTIKNGAKLMIWINGRRRVLS